MRKIATEEHFATQTYQDAPRSRKGFPRIKKREVPESDRAKICHLNAERPLAP